MGRAKIKVRKQGDFYKVSGGGKRFSPVLTMSRSNAYAIAGARRRVIVKRSARRNLKLL
jgi:hypothetical protein